LVADTIIRRSMKLLSISIVLIFVGIVLVAMPDHGAVLIRFNADHGPSLVDTIGLLLILTGWSLMILRVWRSRKDVKKAIGTFYLNLILLLIALCSILIPVALSINNDVLLFSSSSVSLVSQIVLIAVAIRTGEHIK
jgi:hypothetical protein